MPKAAELEQITKEGLQGSYNIDMVPKAGLEPAQLTPLPPQDSVSTNSTTWAMSLFRVETPHPDLLALIACYSPTGRLVCGLVLPLSPAGCFSPSVALFSIFAGTVSLPVVGLV